MPRTMKTGRTRMMTSLEIFHNAFAFQKAPTLMRVDPSGTSQGLKVHLTGTHWNIVTKKKASIARRVVIRRITDVRRAQKGVKTRR